MSDVPSGQSTTARPAGSGEVPLPAMVVERSGGFAGFRDVLEIAADGTARVTSRTGETRSCTPDPAALGALRAIDLAAVASAPSKPPIADGFNYTVRAQSGSASAGDGDVGVRAQFVAAAAAVIMSCLANASASELPES